MRAGLLVLKNAVDGAGLATFIVNATLLNLLQIILLSAIFTTANGGTLTLQSLALGYVYFIPLSALSAAVGAWETELLHGIGEEYLLREASLIATRAPYIAIQCAFPMLVFGSCLSLAGLSSLHMITMVIMALVFSALGTALGFSFGFRHEKSVNNFLNAVTWVLGFGPGPFFGNEPRGYQVLFPGGRALRGDFIAEWTKLCTFLALAIILIVISRRPRRHRFFAR